MTVTALGSLTVGQINPGLALAVASAQLSLNAQIPSIEAQLDGLATALAGLILTPPTLATQLVGAINLVTQVTLAITLGVPGVSFQLDAVVALIAELTATLGSLSAELSIIVGLADLLGMGGVDAYKFEGTCAQLSNQLGDFTNGGFAGGGPGSSGYAIVLTAGTPELWAALSEIFGL
jgi:hypothetical protein